MNALDILVGGYLRKQLQRIECDLMMPRSTGRLAGIYLDYVGNASEVSTERSRPIHISSSQRYLRPLVVVAWAEGGVQRVQLL